MAVDTISFPIAKGDEIKSEHFESLRRRIWAASHPAAGANPIDYSEDNAAAISDDGRGSTTSWADWVNGIGDGTEPGDFTVVYLDAGQTTGDYYTNVDFMTEAQLDANPPSSGGVLNSTWWVLAPDPNKYFHWDRNSDRWFVIYNERTSPTRNHLLIMEAYRWLPIHTDHTQYDGVTATEKVEFNRRYLSQIGVQGARYDAQTTNVSKGGPRIEPNFSEEVPGNQYFNDSGQPGDTTGADSEKSPNVTYSDNGQDDEQFLYEAKICNAYQAMIEYTAESLSYAHPVDAAFRASFAADKRANPVAIAWVPGTYNVGDVVWHDGDGRGIDLYTAAMTTSAEPPAVGEWSNQGLAEYNETLVQTQIGFEELNDDYWECNASAIELLLREALSFDWYWDSTYPWTPIKIINSRFDAGGSADSMYPPPLGTWRRTWKYSFGRISTTMRSSEEGTPVADSWDQTTPTTWYDWPGIFIDVDPDPKDDSSGGIEGSYSTTQAFENNLIARHDVIQEIDSESQYEIVRQMMNEMHDVLELLKYKVTITGLGITVKFDAQSNPTNIDRDTAQESFDDAWVSDFDADIDADWVGIIGNLTLVGFEGTLSWDKGGSGKFNTEVDNQRNAAAVKITGGIDLGFAIASDIRMRLGYVGFNEDDFPSPGNDFEQWVCTIGLPGGTQVTLDSYSQSAVGYIPWEWANLSLDIPEGYEGEGDWLIIERQEAKPEDVSDFSDATEHKISDGVLDWSSSNIVVAELDWDLLLDIVWDGDSSGF